MDVVYSATQGGLGFCVVSGFNETQLFSNFTLRCAKWPSLSLFLVARVTIMVDRFDYF